MTDQQAGPMRRIFSRFWSGVTWLRVSLSNFLFLAVIVLLIVVLSGDKVEPLPKDAALTIAPQGFVVDQLTYVDPLSKLFNSNSAAGMETLLRDITDAIDYARDDDNINSIVLRLDGVLGIGTSKSQEIATSLKAFKDAGKKVFAVSEFYSQGQYLLASHADEIYVDPLGGVALRGFGIYRNYFKQALDKLHVNFHVFRVGTFKSAMEPFMRDDMSEEAKQANRQWLESLWSDYTETVASQREISVDSINDYINNIDEHLQSNQGDMSATAMRFGLVDGIKNRVELEAYLKQEVGVNDKGDLRTVDMYDYLFHHDGLKLPKQGPKIAVLVAKGEILDGDQPTGSVGGDSLAKLIRIAKDDEQTKAVVLRVDSPGGSVFASELIRTELQALQAAGKPLVVSMGSMAASGGYWISAGADEIWATPSTLTGSIGIFGAFPTFERGLDKLGVHTDGVGTTELANAYRVDMPMNPIAVNAIQQSIEFGYRRFLNIVAEGREMTEPDVDNIAQGRVWVGRDALENGLVDKLGYLPEAIASAAQMAQLSDYEVEYVEKGLSPMEQVLNELPPLGQIGHSPMLQSLDSWLGRIGGGIASVLRFNDPRNTYAFCEDCASF